MNTNGTFMNGIIVLVSEGEKVEFDSKVKYSSSKNIIESININLMKIFYFKKLIQFLQK